MLTKRGRIVRNIGIGLIALLIWESATARAEAPVKVEEVSTQLVKEKTIEFPVDAWSPAIAKAYAEYSMDEYGWKDSEFKCLVALWTRESNWRWKAKSPTSDYGIPQRHMRDKSKAEIEKFLSDPMDQISWGLGYIDHRYGSPCQAKNHSDLKGWY